MRSLLCTLALAATLIAAPAQAAMFGGKDKNDVDPDARLTVADFIKVSGKEKLTGASKVVIPNFFVQFVRDQTIERKGRIGAAHTPRRSAASTTRHCRALRMRFTTDSSAS
ncbi:MAG: hypothetical protein IPM70_05725 [Proteobacteria bacterium]|nr:hypothetical protein [Pseudomonadota bacterium]